MTQMKVIWDSTRIQQKYIITIPDAREKVFLRSSFILSILPSIFVIFE